MLRPMTPKEWLKYDWRINLFEERYKNNIPFYDINENEVVFEFDPQVLKDFKSKEKEKLRSIILHDYNKNSYRLSNIGKCSKLGGRSGLSKRHEKIQLAKLKRRLSYIKKENNTDTVRIKIKKDFFDVYDVIQLEGYSKADFALIDKDKNEVAWLSLKDGNSPTSFQQWGGISKLREKEISQNKETKDFVKTIKTLYPQEFPPRKVYIRKIKSEKLRHMSVYGNEFGSKNYSRQNVNIVLQGEIELRKRLDYFYFTSHHTLLNGQKIKDDYEPVFMARFDSKRSDAGIKNARIFIAAYGGKITKKEI